MASVTLWTNVWLSSRSWWWTGKPGVLQSMVLQRVRHNWVTKLHWIYYCTECPRHCSQPLPIHPSDGDSCTLTGKFASVSFEPRCWIRLLSVPWTARRANQSILKEISPEHSLEALMLKLKLQYVGHLTQRTDSIGKDPDAVKDWRQEEKWMTEGEMARWNHWLDGHDFE